MLNCERRKVRRGCWFPFVDIVKKGAESKRRNIGIVRRREQEPESKPRPMRGIVVSRLL